MILINARNKIKIADDAKIAVSFLDKFLGLLNPYNPRYLILYTRFGVHTLFMQEDIEVLVLDKKERIKIIKNKLAPYRLFFYPVKYSTVVELPMGTIAKADLRLNDKILFV